MIHVDCQPRDIRCVGNLQLKRLTAGSGIAIVALHTKRATNGHGAVVFLLIAARLVIRNLDGLNACLVGTHDLKLRGRLDLAHRRQTFAAHKPRERQADDKSDCRQQYQDRKGLRAVVFYPIAGIAEARLHGAHELTPS